MRLLLRIAFFTFSFLYLLLWCEPVLTFNEGLRIFTYDTQSLSNAFGKAGGVLVYGGDFISQFFYYPWVGVAIVSCLLSAIAFITGRLYAGKSSLQYLPSLLLLLVITRIYAPVELLLGVAITLGALLVVERVKHKQVAGAILVVIISFISSGFALIFIAVLLVSNVRNFIPAVAYLLTMVVAYTVLYPNQSLWQILFANTDYAKVNYFFAALPATIVLLPLTRKYFVGSVNLLVDSSLLVAAMASVVIFTPLDSPSRALLRMDFYAQTFRWQKIIETAHKQQQLSRQHTFYLMLALNQTRQIGDKLFHYKQLWDSGSLYEGFNNNVQSLLAAGEMYYAIGCDNYAYRMSMEASVINNRAMVARTAKRMAYCALESGDMPLYEKHRKLLSKTLYYDKEINKESFIDYRRKLLPGSDNLLGDSHNSFLFFKGLAQANPDNCFVVDYLLCDALLKGRVDLFMENLPLAEKFYPEHLPVHYQEAAVAYALEVDDDELLNRYGTQKVADRYVAYIEALSKNISAAMVEKEFADTFWYYMYKRASKTNVKFSVAPLS